MSGGQQITSGQGVVTASGGTIVLVGSAVTGSQGVLTGGQRGQQFQAAQGVVGSVVSCSLSGAAITAGDGTVIAQAGQLTLTGAAIASAPGNVSADGTPLTVNITGSESAFAAGFVESGGTLISGSAMTGAQGSYGLACDVALVGSAFTSDLGSVSAGQDAEDTSIASSQGSAGISADVALVGSQSTGAQGTIQVTGDVALPLVGEQSASAAGSVGFEQAYALVGSEITGAQYSVGAPGGAALTGAEITSVAGDVFLTNDRTFALAGEQFSALAGITFASSLAFPPGQALTISQQTMGPKNVALSGASASLALGVMEALGGDRVGGAADYAGNSGKPKKRKFLREIAGKVVEFPTAEAAVTAFDPSLVVEPVAQPEEVAEPVVETAEVEDEEALLEMLVMTL